jgi:superoxide oxidase
MSSSISSAPASALPYTSWAIISHWLLFVLVVLVGTLGLLHDSWPRHSQAFWINLHAVSGLAVWVLVVARFSARLKRPPPPFPAGVSASIRRWSRIIHLLLYALLFVVPIIGAVTFIWHGRILDLGLTQINFGVAKDRAIFEPSEDLHGYLAYCVFGLATFHAMAALWHRFIKHDAVFRRMWPSSAGNS